MAFQLGDDQHFTLSLTGVDDAGNAVPMTPGEVSGVPTWTSDSTALTVTAAGDGLSADIAASGALVSGAAVSVAGNLSTGSAFSVSFAVDVVTTAAVGVGVSASTPAHK